MKKGTAFSIIAILSALVIAFAAIHFTNNAEKTKQIEALNADVVDKASQIETLNADVADKADQIETLNADVADKAGQIDTMNADVADKASQIETLNADVADKAGQIEALNADLSEKKGKIEEQTATIAELQSQVDNLLEENAALNHKCNEEFIGLRESTLERLLFYGKKVMFSLPSSIKYDIGEPSDGVRAFADESDIYAAGHIFEIVQAELPVDIETLGDSGRMLIYDSLKAQVVSIDILKNVEFVDSVILGNVAFNFSCTLDINGKDAQGYGTLFIVENYAHILFYAGANKDADEVKIEMLCCLDTIQLNETGITSDLPITLTCFIGDPGDQPTEDNKIYKMIEEKFGVKFKFEYLAGDLDEKLGMIISSQDYPDLFCGGNSADLIISNGALINLLDYVSPEKTPRLWAHIEPQRNRLIEKDANGNDVLYIIPNSGLPDGPEIALSVGGPAFFIQKQVLADAGYPDVKNITLDGYFDLIENFLAKHPTQDDGTPYIGFAILCEDWRHFCLINPVQHLMGRPNDGEVLVDVNDPDFHTETFIDKDYAKAYYRKLNEEFHKGIIKRDTFSMSHKQYIAAISSGRVLGMFDHAWDFGSATSDLVDAKMYENTYVALGPVYSEKDIEGVEMPTANWKIEEHYLNGSLPNVRRGFGISVKSKHAEKIVAMWEEMMSDEWQLIFNWGIEGEDYTIDKNGRLTMTAVQYANAKNAAWRLANKADGLTINSPKKQGWILNDIKVGNKTVKAGNCWEPGNQDEIVYAQMNDYDKEFLSKYNYSKWADFVNPPIELAPYGEAWQIDYTPVDVAHTEFTKIQDVRLPEIIMCDPDEFDTRWYFFTMEIYRPAKAFQDYMQEKVVIEAHKVLDNK